MYVIVLRGAGNSGKTTTLNDLKDDLTGKGWDIIFEEQYGANSKDYCYVLIKGNMKIGIITFGDIQRDTKFFLTKLEINFKADIAVIAYNKHHKRQIYRDYDHNVIPKTRNNWDDIKEILKHIKTRITL